MRLPADPERPVKTTKIALIAVLVILNSALAQGGECVFDRNGLRGIKVGDPEAKIREVFAAGYKVAEQSSQSAQRRVEVFQFSSNEKLYSFSLSSDGSVVFIDIYAPCRNSDGIGIGSRLGDAQKPYGKAKLEPTDTGYFVVFTRIPTVGFMLNNDDIPKKLRNLPDDSITKKIEQTILSMSHARISQIRIYPE